MNLQELRDMLDAYPDDMTVCVDGYEGGVTETIGIGVCEVALNVHTARYYGEHALITDPADYVLYERRQILLLSREA